MIEGPEAAGAVQNAALKAALVGSKQRVIQETNRANANTEGRGLGSEAGAPSAFDRWSSGDPGR